METPMQYHHSAIRLSQDELQGFCGSPETTCKLCISVCVFARYSMEQVHGSHLILRGAPDHRKVRTAGIKEYPQDLESRRIQAQHVPTHAGGRGPLRTGIESPFPSSLPELFDSCWHLLQGAAS